MLWASTILWRPGDTVEAAGRPSGYQMNYSIRDNIPPSSTSPVSPGRDRGCWWTPCRTWGRHGAQNHPCWLTPPQEQALTMCYCPRGDQDRALHLPHPTETNVCPVRCRTRGHFSERLPESQVTNGFSSSPKETFARFLRLEQNSPLLLQMHHTPCSTGINSYWGLFTLTRCLGPNQTLEIHIYPVCHYKILHLILYQQLISCTSYPWMCWPHVLNIWKSQLGLSLIPVVSFFYVKASL